MGDIDPKYNYVDIDTIPNIDDKTPAGEAARTKVVDEALAQIMTAIYGEEVRTSIHNAIKAMRKESNTAYNAAIAAKDSTEASASAAKTSEINAAGSASAALASQNAAKTSETNAKTSENNANTRATNAANSASAALASQNAAKTSETNAATSEANAAASETNSSKSASAAATSESNAKTSETNAKTSETNAATSETNAATSEANAKKSADKAEELANISTSPMTGATATADGKAGYIIAPKAGDQNKVFGGDGTWKSGSDVINSLGEDNTDPTDNDYYVTPTARKKHLNLWNYIKGKIQSVLGLTSSNYGGKAATAGTADEANSVAWGNVSGRPTALSSFTNDVGYKTTDTNTWPQYYSQLTDNIGYLKTSGGTMSGYIRMPDTLDNKPQFVATLVQCTAVSTLNQLIDNMFSIGSGGSMGSIYISSDINTTFYFIKAGADGTGAINAGWYHYICVPHGAGNLAGGDQLTYKGVILFPLRTNVNQKGVYVLRFSKYHDCNATYIG